MDHDLSSLGEITSKKYFQVFFEIQECQICLQRFLLGNYLWIKSYLHFTWKLLKIFTIGVDVSTRCSGLFSCSSWRCWASADTNENVTEIILSSLTKFLLSLLLPLPAQLMPSARILLSNCSSSFPACKRNQISLF